MKKFAVAQKFDASRASVIAAFRKEETWRDVRGLPFVGDPTLERFADGEPVEVAMSYRVSIDLPPLADKFIDPNKLTFVEETVLREDGTGSFLIIPDHYKKLLKSSGTSEVVAIDDDRCERRINGIVDVSLGWSGLLFEGPVEEAIVNGLQSAVIAQSEQIQTV